MNVLRAASVLSLAAALLAAVSTASAVPVLQYQVLDGATVIGSGATTAGIISISGSDARFSTVGGFASSAPTLAVPDFSTSVFSIQSAASASAATLTIRVCATGLTGYAGGNVASVLTLNSLNGGPFASGTVSTYFDNNNVAYGTGTPLATRTYTGLNTFSDSSTTSTSPSALFSETAIYTLNYGAGGSSTISASSQVNAVPEPATMAALGLGAVALLKRRKNA